MRQKDELSKISELTGISKSNIVLNKTGWTSRVYIIDGGRIVFKFPKNKKEVKNFIYEIEVMKTLKGKDFGLKIPELNWYGENGAYMGFYGVLGSAVTETAIDAMTERQKETFGVKIGLFLKRLHLLSGTVHPIFGADGDEIKRYQAKLKKAEPVLRDYFLQAETERIFKLFMSDAPKRLAELGRDTVFCHGDLGYNNILIDNNLSVGVIDFGDAGLYDRAKDFVGLEDKTVLAAALNSYGGDAALREKVSVWQKLLPVFLMLFLMDRKDTAGIKDCVTDIKSFINR